jgi:hypothetical protein
MPKKGWRKESARHALAAQGVKTRGLATIVRRLARIRTPNAFKLSTEEHEVLEKWLECYGWDHESEVPPPSLIEDPHIPDTKDGKWAIARMKQVLNYGIDYSEEELKDPGVTFTTSQETKDYDKETRRDLEVLKSIKKKWLG